MKKIAGLILTAVLIVILAGGCKREQFHETPPTLMPTDLPTEAPTEAPDSSQAPEITEGPAITGTIHLIGDSETEEEQPVTDIPEAASREYTYEDILGSWYLYCSEIEGYESLAVNENENCCVTFNEDMTASLFTAYYYEPGDEPYISETSGPVSDLGDASVWGRWLANFDLEGCTYYYSLNEEGNLVQMCDIVYDDEYETVSYAVFVREQQVFEPIPPTVPASVQAIMDGAADNNWITFICDPDAEMTAELNEAGWMLHDETENEYLDYPITRPVELVICNTSDRAVDIQVHEPGREYDPSSEEYTWVRGGFMYWAHLEPGEITRFVVDMAEVPREATMAIYFAFEGDPEDNGYYIRVYRYSDPYMSF